MLVAKADGARVMVSDLDPERCKKAKDMGAHLVFNPKETDVTEAVKKVTDGRGADVVICAIGVGAANKQALATLGPLGRMMLFASAHPAEDVCVDPNYVHRNQIVITGSVSGDVHGFSVATKLLSTRLIDVKPLIQATMPLAMIQEALELASRAERTYRIELTM
jgi:L-iditol 2-dehydrogenase